MQRLELCYSASEAVDADRLILDFPMGLQSMKLNAPNVDDPEFSIDTVALGRIDSLTLTIGRMEKLAKAESDTSTSFLNSLIATVGRRADADDLEHQDVRKLSAPERDEFARRFLDNNQYLFGNYIHGSTRSRADSDYATMVFPGPDSLWRLAKSGAVRSRLSRCLPVLGPPQAISGLIEDSPRPRPHCSNPARMLDLSNVNS